MVSYTIENLNGLVEWLEGSTHRANDAEEWAESLRIFADEYAIRETNEARAYERGYRAGQISALNKVRNFVAQTTLDVTADAELSAISIERKEAE